MKWAILCVTLQHLWRYFLSNGTFDSDTEIRIHYPTLGVFISGVNYGETDCSGAAARCYFNTLSYMVRICQVTAVVLCFQSLHLFSLCGIVDPLLKISQPSCPVFHLKSEWKLSSPPPGADALTPFPSTRTVKLRYLRRFPLGMLCSGDCMLDIPRLSLFALSVFPPGVLGSFCWTGVTPYFSSRHLRGTVLLMGWKIIAPLCFDIGVRFPT